MREKAANLEKNTEESKRRRNFEVESGQKVTLWWVKMFHIPY